MTKPRTLKLLRQSNTRPEFMAVIVPSKTWLRLGAFDHNQTPSIAVRTITDEFADWIEDTVQGVVYYDARFIDKRATWIMLFSDTTDAVAFKLRWL